MYTGSSFKITAEEHAKIKAWLEETVYPPIIAEQLKDPELAGMLFEDDDGKIRHPYTGAIGGGLTYEFTPTSLGTVFRVTWAHGGPRAQTLDLTEYNDW